MTNRDPARILRLSGIAAIDSSPRRVCIQSGTANVLRRSERATLRLYDVQVTLMRKQLRGRHVLDRDRVMRGVGNYGITGRIVMGCR